MILLHKIPQKIPNPKIPQRKILQPKNTMTQNEIARVLTLCATLVWLWVLLVWVIVL